MVEWFLVLPAAYLVFWLYRAAARTHVRHAMRGAAGGAAALRWWAESPISPVKIEARLYLAEAARREDPGLAMEVLGPALDLPGRAAIPGLLLAAQWALHDRWGVHAERHYREALSRLRLRRDNIMRATIFRLMAENALRDGRFGEAGEFLDHALAENPYHSEARLLRAGLSFNRGDLEAASQDFAFLESKFGNAALRVRAALGASQVDLVRSDYTGALRRIDAVLADAPQYAAGLERRRLVVQALSGDSVGACNALDRLQIDDAYAALVRGAAAMGDRNWDEAQRRLTEFVLRGAPSDPQAAEAMWLLIGALRQAGREEQAADTSKRLAELWPETIYLSHPWPAGSASPD